jgi:hypothetical protein
MPYTLTRETVPEFYRCIHAAEQVIRINESICDGTYQPPNTQFLNTIPTYPTSLNKQIRRGSSPVLSVISESSSRVSSQISLVSPSVQARRKARVQSVTNEEDEPHANESADPTIAARPSGVPSVPPNVVHQLPPFLRSYIPGRQHDWSIHSVDRIAFALFEHGISATDHANISIPDKESNRVKVIDWLLGRVIAYRT